jgi:hypothetical protein
MRHGQLLGVQPQALLAQALRPPAVERAFAMGGVSHDGVADVFEVPADLVAPAGEGGVPRLVEG